MRRTLERGCIEFFKTDVDRSSIVALRGAEHTLTHLKPWIVVSLNPLTERDHGTGELLDWLSARDYCSNACSLADFAAKPMLPGASSISAPEGCEPEAISVPNSRQATRQVGQSYPCKIRRPADN